MPQFSRGVRFIPASLLTVSASSAFAAGPNVFNNARWCDYSSMTVDPTDDCTFWYTQEYYIFSASFNWATRVAAFKFDNCKPGGK